MKNKPRAHRDKAITSKIMSSVRGKGSKAEKMLAKAMWRIGLRYRKHSNCIIGKPDYVFVGPKVVVFCDGDFWHGMGWEKRGFGSWEEQFEGLHNSAFWREKIARNMERDKKVTKQLQNEGWIVLRFLESEILDDADKHAQIVLRTIKPTF
ncbi:MAG: very short patch repair endonuclease [Desulfobacteraceae bacterium]|nr:very short patch repair endonuclease [Desulfobacteraceae bacterium]